MQTTENRKGDWIQTRSGTRFYILDPRLEEFHIEDIAHSLSHQCRYLGHTEKFYSIAEHSVLLSDYLGAIYGPSMAYCALMHDGAEAYYLDIPRPIKNNMPGLKEAMLPIDKMYAEKFGLPYPMDSVVEKADKRIVVDEKNALMDSGSAVTGEGIHWHSYNNLEPLNVTINAWLPDQAKEEFLVRYWKLKNAKVS